MPKAELKLTIRDPIVLRYFEENPHISPEELLVQVVGLLTRFESRGTTSEIISAIRDLSMKCDRHALEQCQVVQDGERRITETLTSKMDTCLSATASGFEDMGRNMTRTKEGILECLESVRGVIANDSGILRSLIGEVKDTLTGHPNKILSAVTDVMVSLFSKQGLSLAGIESHVVSIHSSMQGASLRDVCEALERLTEGQRQIKARFEDHKAQVAFDTLKVWLTDHFLRHMSDSLKECEFSDLKAIRESINVLALHVKSDQEHMAQLLSHVDHGIKRLETCIDKTHVEQEHFFQNQLQVVTANGHNIHGSLARSEDVLAQVRADLDQVLLMCNNVSSLSSTLEHFVNPTKSAAKGLVAEGICEVALRNLFPLHTVTKKASKNQKGNMDFQLNKEGHPTVMMDIKRYAKTVPKKEIDKFLADMDLGKRHAILLCVECQTTERHHFQIEVTKHACIAVYLNNMRFEDLSDLTRAVNVIYLLDTVIKRYQEGNVHSLSLTQIQQANASIQSHFSELRQVHDSLKICVSRIEDLLKSSLIRALQVADTCDSDEASL